MTNSTKIIFLDFESSKGLVLHRHLFFGALFGALKVHQKYRNRYSEV